MTYLCRLLFYQDLSKRHRMSSNDASQADEYIRQMRALKPGYLPIWNPAPFHGQEVQLGDVGYIYKHSFRRLFNAFHAANHPYNQGTVPDKFQPFRLSSHLPIPENDAAGESAFPSNCSYKSPPDRSQNPQTLAAWIPFGPWGECKEMNNLKSDQNPHEQ